MSSTLDPWLSLNNGLWAQCLDDPDFDPADPLHLRAFEARAPPLPFPVLTGQVSSLPPY
jgi:hypothetical protein